MNDDNSPYLDFTKQPDFQDILTNPILDIAARFWEDDRYQAFKICYRSMRVVDDLVDDRKASGQKISVAEKLIIKKMIKDWLKSFNNHKPNDDFQKELLDTIEKFKIPKWPWQRLAKAMIYDIDHNGFDSFLTFLRYTEGAAISPAAVFMHLCGVQKMANGYLPPEYDIRNAARPLALFSYIVHIIRDFEKDLNHNLIYFADNTIKLNNLTNDDLFSYSQTKEISQNLRNLIKQYYQFAEYYRLKAVRSISLSKPYLDDRYKLSLELIYQLYCQIFNRIDWANGNFSTSELNPTASEVQAQITDTIQHFSKS
jgi:phytoene/squalene synthetase